jgi:putative two-component system response regulator
MSREAVGPRSAGHVLAVDDQEQNLELLEELLTAAGYRVSLARDGAQALRAVEIEQPDCILLDIMMPRLDGYEVCSRLKARSRTRFVPVLMLTALAEVADKVRALDAGADDFLNKPVRPEELLARTRALVRIRRLRDELETAEDILFGGVRALDRRDPRRGGHAERVAVSALAAATALGVPSRDHEAVFKGALLHDLGKLGLPEPGLGDALPPEGAGLREHPLLGERILAPLRSWTIARDIVRHHHERTDGSGYPDGLVGDALSLPAEVVAVANHLDGLLGRLDHDQAAAELRQMVGQGRFQQRVVDAGLGPGVAALAGWSEQSIDPWRDLAPLTAPPPAATILVCDDLASNRELMQEVLEGAGYSVVAVESGEAVIPVLGEVQPDLVLLDIRVPELSGFEVCEWIKRTPETEFLPVVLVTALSDSQDRARSAQVGADDFLLLPVVRTELLARVRSLLRLRLYHRELEDHRAALHTLASALEGRDPARKGRAERVAELGRCLGQELGLSPEECEQLRLAGQLLALSEVAVPQRVDREGDAIRIGARILALAVAFVDLTTARENRPALQPEQALEELAHGALAGRWDPAVYSALAAMTRKGEA